MLVTKAPTRLGTIIRSRARGAFVPHGFLLRTATVQGYKCDLASLEPEGLHLGFCRRRTNNLGCDSRVPSCQGLRRLRLGFLCRGTTKILITALSVACTLFFPTRSSKYLTHGGHVVVLRYHTGGSVWEVQYWSPRVLDTGGPYPSEGFWMCAG